MNKVINLHQQKTTQPSLFLLSQMTLRRIHQNLTSIKNHKPQPHIQRITNHESTLYDQQQPPHPKMFVQSPVKWANSRIKADIDKMAKTAREGRGFRESRGEKGKLTALNSSRRSKFQTIGPSNNNSPREQQQQLFIPQRKKMLQQNKLALMKQSPSNLRNTSFSSMRKKPLSPQQNQQISQTQIKPQIKLIQPNKTIHHISHLRKYQNQQKQRQTLLNNRLKFITIGNQKENKKLQMVRRKFEKVVGIRSQSLKEKEVLSKTKSIIQNQQKNYKVSKVSSVKQQQHSRRLSISRLTHNKTMQASLLRQEEKHIQREILSSRLTELQKKKQAVLHAQSSLQKSRERISSLNRSRISSIRSLQNKTLIKNYMNVQKRQQINQKLHQTLQKEIKLINERKLKAASELKQYEQFLGLGGKDGSMSRGIGLSVKDNKTANSIEIPHKALKGRPKMERAVSSTFSTSGSKSFYLTNC